MLGDTWAIREYNQHIQVWRIGGSDGGGGAERFCALVRYQGSFSTLAGPSPRGTDSHIAANIDGSFEGGYRLVFNADEIASPTSRDRGHIGANDMQWWGWIYHGGNNGAWATSTLGEQGDLID